MHNYFLDITEHAERNSPNEVCGFLHPDGNHSLSYTPVRNLASLESFAVNTSDVVAAYAKGPIAAFVHSHCQHDATFSDPDLDNLNRTRLPWFVYSTKSHTFNFRRPTGVCPPFEGREFIMGLNDCAGLVMDYFQRFFNYAFPYFTRPLATIELGYAYDCISLRNAGFQEVTGPTKPHDVILMRLGFDKPVTHVGVLVREGLLLHQLKGTVSSIEQYSGQWQRLTRFVFRHPEFTSKLPVL